MLRLFTAFLVLATGVASARTLVCSTADQYFSYSLDATDGGAPRPDVIIFKLGGQIAPKGTKLSFVEKTAQGLTQSKSGNFVTTTYTQLVQVTPPGSERPSVNDHAICRLRSYVGPPIPSAPPGKGGRD